MFNTLCNLMASKPLVFNFLIILYSLKYQRSTTSDCKDTGIRKSDFVAKTQFLYETILARLCDLVAPLVGIYGEV